ncbi:DUF5753 domain-containing protein [Streptomyces sp. NPDC002308]
MNRAPQLGNRTSTVLGRRLGSELLRLRDAAGKTQQQAAQAITATNSKIVKMERGWVPMRDPDIRALCDFYGVDDRPFVDRQLELAALDRERRKVRGWWTGTVHSSKHGEYIAMEDGALRTRQWQLALIPGLFQTPEYTRAMCVAEMRWEDPARLEAVVATRARRQQRLFADDPLRMHAVIWEGALRQLIGGPQVMRRQLERLCELAEMDHIHIQVLPFRAGGHMGVTGPFNILSFREDEAMDVVHMDAPRSEIWVEDAEESAAFVEAFTALCRTSLSPHDTGEFIKELSKGIGYQ